MSARKVVYTGISTFPRMIVINSNKVDTIYVPGFLKNNNFYNGDLCYFEGINTNQINIENYINCDEWDWNENIKNIFLK
jgi:hypothetical protein